MDGSGRYVDPDAMVAAGQQFLETDDDPGPSFAPLSSLGPPKADVRAQVGEIDSLPIEECVALCTFIPHTPARPPSLGHSLFPLCTDNIEIFNLPLNSPSYPLG